MKLRSVQESWTLLRNRDCRETEKSEDVRREPEDVRRDVRREVAVSPEEEACEHNFMMPVSKDKKDHVISKKASDVWAVAKHLWRVYESMLVVISDTQEKGLPSGTQVADFIEQLTLVMMASEQA